MEVFSLGMLFLWLIFERYFSETELLPKEAQWANPSFEHEHKNRLWDVLEKLKNEDNLVLLAHQLLTAENGLDPEKNKNWRTFSAHL